MIYEENRRCPRGGFPVIKPLYAALWKFSIWRIQLVSGFHLGQIWATTFLIFQKSLNRKRLAGSIGEFAPAVKR